jgi:hypothetical protein
MAAKTRHLKFCKSCVKEKKSISVSTTAKKNGKAEAVRFECYLAKANANWLYRFLDADLSTNFEDFDDLVQTISNSNYKIVSGSRINRMGADIAKESARANKDRSI